MEKPKSSIPGFAYLPARDERGKTADGFLWGRRMVDGAEDLWRIGNSLYDLGNFADNHPGGPEWIQLTRGTDITELFETHHLTDKAEKILPKFYVRETKCPRSIPLTFASGGFYKTFKKRAVDLLKAVDFHRSSTTSNRIADFLLFSTFSFSLLAAFTQSKLATVAAGVCLTWTTVIGHNYFHMRNNFRMYYFDLSTMSSKDWRITHVMSHHMYPNTIWDHEIYAVEPFLQWLPNPNKYYLSSVLSQLSSPIIWATLFLGQAVKRMYVVLFVRRRIEFRDIVPLTLPSIMMLVAPHPTAALTTWLAMLLISSFLFGMIGFNAAHHHPNIFHDGDIYRDDLDWGLLELDAVRERQVVDDNNFLVLTNFGNHALHHLLPTVDHCYLPLLADVFEQTCKEFNVSAERWTQWELIKGQFKQLARNVPKKNAR